MDVTLNLSVLKLIALQKEGQNNNKENLKKNITQALFTRSYEIAFQLSDRLSLSSNRSWVSYLTDTTAPLTFFGSRIEGSIFGTNRYCRLTDRFLSLCPLSTLDSSTIPFFYDYFVVFCCLCVCVAVWIVRSSLNDSDDDYVLSTTVEPSCHFWSPLASESYLVSVWTGLGSESRFRSEG